MAETSTPTQTQEKARKLCYKRRAACIIKKAIELQILCGLKIGVVILSPDGKLESWPPELNDVKVLLDAGKERTRVKSEKRKGDNPETSHREILVSKLQLLNKRVEFFKGKEIASTSQGGETLVRSKKRKEFGEEGCLEVLNSKLQLLKKREMMFLNPSPNSSASAEGKEIDLFDDLDLDLGGEDDDFFFNLVADPQNNAGKDKEIEQQNSFTAAEECGEEVQVRKKARLQQYPIAPLNNNLPLLTPHPAADYWETLFTNVVNSTDAMLSLLQDL
ncbi:PREDICTED: uncharacterized protein LOC109148578 isoform X2 [Ipomoea nil]|uniref:uncharacterized protein LOC109148578 isoform X2 n=1 Tax=Ipomoea nil TaxID=35883 RepID=UPI0009009932|nr:PREDICTED: uncharacterized protein LOC109148578 isoform X2 [Ipomoea nil]